LGETTTDLTPEEKKEGIGKISASTSGSEDKKDQFHPGATEV